MFLTRKALRKIRLLVGAYFAIGAFCLVAWLVLYVVSRREEGPLLVILGLLCFLLGLLFRQVGRYAEGKGRLINSGNKLILHQLLPDEFIRLYQEMRDGPDTVIAKPDFDVLRLVIAAYDALGDTEHTLETLSEMRSIAPDKKKPQVKLLTASVLFSVGRVEEAEPLFNEGRQEGTDVMTRSMADLVLKSDRAMALGDFSTAELYYRQALTQPFPKATPLSLLYGHFALARICSKTGRLEEAKVHCTYCVENGGHTAVQAEAVKMAEEL